MPRPPSKSRYESVVVTISEGSGTPLDGFAVAEQLLSLQLVTPNSGWKIVPIETVPL